MMPLVPGITTSRAIVERTLQAIADAGARFVGTNVARLEPGVREHFFAFLDSGSIRRWCEGYRRLYTRGAAPSAAMLSEIKAMVKVGRRPA